MSRSEYAAGPGPVRVEPVVHARQFDEFVALPGRLHGATHQVPILQPQLRTWWTNGHPRAVHGPVTFLLARDSSGAVVGRTCVHHDPDFDNKVGERTQLFGLTDFADPQVLAAMLDHVSATGRATASSQILGPVALLPNQTGGVITSGFEDRGFMDSPWNPPGHPVAYEAAGCEPIFEGATWICEDLQDLDPDVTFPIDEQRVTRDGWRVETVNRLRLTRDLEAMRTVLNASFAALPYYTQISRADLAAQTEGLVFLLDESLFLRVTRDARTVAFVLVVPDISDFVMARGGRLTVTDQLTLLATKRRYRRDAILIIKGTFPELAGQGLMTLLSRELLRHLRSRGYRTLRSTFVEDSNAASAAQYVRMGGQPLHRTTFYRRAIR